jgi:Epoxide hydrolase N terminus
LPGDDWDLGVPVAYLRGLSEYWRDGYDWRRAEARLNAVPQFTTEIDGQRIHFLHVRSPHDGAMPLLLTHGWPGSVVEFLDIIEPTTSASAISTKPKTPSPAGPTSLPAATSRRSKYPRSSCATFEPSSERCAGEPGAEHPRAGIRREVDDVLTGRFLATPLAGEPVAHQPKRPIT